jgi:hypothetical protein
MTTFGAVVFIAIGGVLLGIFAIVVNKAVARKYSLKREGRHRPSR